MSHFIITTELTQTPLINPQPKLKTFLNSKRLQNFIHNSQSVNLFQLPPYRRFSEQQMQQIALEKDLFIESNFRELGRQLKKHTRPDITQIIRENYKLGELSKEGPFLKKKGRINGSIKSNRLFKVNLKKEAKMIQEHKEQHHFSDRNQNLNPNFAKMTFLLQRLTKKQNYRLCVTESHESNAQLCHPPNTFRKSQASCNYKGYRKMMI